MKAKLVGISGWDGAAPIELVLPLVLGRSRRVGLIVPHALVSRQHCEFFELNGKLMIRDLGSMNGTRVNQVRIEQPVELCAGDLVTVGSVTFRIDCEENPATLADHKDETAVVRRSNLDQLLKVPVEESLMIDHGTEKGTISASSDATLPIPHSVPVTTEQADPSHSTAEPPGPDDPGPRKPR